MGKNGRNIHPFRLATPKADAKDAMKYKPTNANHAARNTFRNATDPLRLAVAAKSRETIPTIEHEIGPRLRGGEIPGCFRTTATFQNPF